MPKLPDAEQWRWDAAAQKYRSVATGRFLPAARIQKMRDDLLAAAMLLMDSLAGDLARGSQDVGGWESSMRKIIQSVFGAQYVFGRGGLKAMQPADWTALGQLVQEQDVFLQGFADDVAAGKLSQPQITLRAEMYVGSSVQAHEAGKGAAWQVELPAMPGDGSSECLSNDRCSWFLRRRDDGKVEATWVAKDDGRICKTCKQRARDWNPLVLTPNDWTRPADVPGTSRLRTPSRTAVRQRLRTGQHVSV